MSFFLFLPSGRGLGAIERLLCTGRRSQVLDVDLRWVVQGCWGPTQVMCVAVSQSLAARVLERADCWSLNMGVGS